MGPWADELLDKSNDNVGPTVQSGPTAQSAPTVLEVHPVVVSESNPVENCLRDSWILPVEASIAMLSCWQKLLTPMFWDP